MCKVFTSSSLLLGDFSIAETTLTSSYSNVVVAVYYLAPYMFIQAMERMEFGLTQVEIRALQELG